MPAPALERWSFLWRSFWLLMNMFALRFDCGCSVERDTHSPDRSINFTRYFMRFSGHPEQTTQEHSQLVYGQAGAVPRGKMSGRNVINKSDMQ
jgi:hypothetical protein